MIAALFKRSFLLTSFLAGALLVEAQEHMAVGVCFNTPEQGTIVTVLADTAYIRSVPATGGLQIGVLTAGARLTFLNNEDNVQTIRGFTAPWAHVRYTDKGVTQEGYIWKGLLALGSYERDGKRFLYGVDRGTANSLQGSVLVLDSLGAMVAGRKWMLGSNEATSYTEGKVLGNMGLDGITSILRIYFTGEACGIPSDYYYFGWTGTELLLMPGKTDISDASVFYHTESIFFPSEKGGQPGKIVKLIEDEEATEEMDKNGEPKMKKTNRKEVYSWDGKQAVKEKG